MRKALILAACILCSSLFHAQSVQVSPSNKTIAITADESVSVDADVAVVTFACETYAPSHKEAYDANLVLADSLVKAILSSGVAKEAIRSGNISVKETQPDEKWSEEQKKQRRYYANQSWSITVLAGESGKLIDLGMKNGANRLENIDWRYSNMPELQAKAGAVALAKARNIAEQMARGLGTRLGNLIYASNYAEDAEEDGGIVMRKMVLSPPPPPPPPSLQLFPNKVKQPATVHAVFAIE